jgi:hypothetical protein
MSCLGSAQIRYRCRLDARHLEHKRGWRCRLRKLWRKRPRHSRSSMTTTCRESRLQPRSDWLRLRRRRARAAELRSKSRRADRAQFSGAGVSARYTERLCTTSERQRGTTQPQKHAPAQSVGNCAPELVPLPKALSEDHVRSHAEQRSQPGAWARPPPVPWQPWASTGVAWNPVGAAPRHRHTRHRTRTLSLSSPDDLLERTTYIAAPIES